MFRRTTLPAILVLVFLASPALMAFNPSPVFSTQQTKAKKKNTETAANYVSLAKEAIENDKWSQVEKWLRKAKKADPDYPETYKILGDFHTAFSRHKKADKFYKKAQELEARHLASK